MIYAIFGIKRKIIYREKREYMTEQTGLRKIKIGQDFITIVNMIHNMRKMQITDVAGDYIDINTNVKLYFNNRVLTKITHICPVCGMIEDVSDKQCKTEPCRLCRRNKCKQEKMLHQLNNIDYGMGVCVCGNVFKKSCKYNRYCPTCQTELDDPLNFKQLMNYSCHISGDSI